MALVAPGRESLVYGALQEQLQHAIDRLLWAGIRRQDRVFIVLGNGPELAVALMAVSSCAIGVPLNTGCTNGDLQRLVSELSPSAMIVDGNAAGTARSVAVNNDIALIEVFREPSSPAGIFDLQCKRISPAVEATPPAAGDTVLLLPTSGTTSHPKLVPLTNANLASSIRGVVSSLQLDDTDRCLNILPLFHVHGIVAALLASLSAGGSVVCTPGYDQESFFGWLEEYGSTWYTAVPTMHQAVLSAAGRRSRGIERGPLRFIRSSSAALPQSVRSRLEHVFSVPVVEAYGMTEAAHQIASNALPPDERRPGSVGRAAGPEVVVLDEDGNILPPDAYGEIAIRGPSVTSGYLHNAQANAEAFADGWFRTGDRGRIDPDGFVYLAGRLDETINRGGVVISPVEIDLALQTHPDIVQAAAFPIPHPTLGQDVAAAVVLGDRGALSESEIRAFAFSCMADFKVPSQVVELDEIPVWTTGKVTRNRLSQQLRHLLDKDHLEPGNAVEALVADIVREVLGADRVGVHDNFFLLGGDSLTAVQVTGRLDRFLQIRLPVTAIFHNPTVREIASEIKTQIETSGRSDLMKVLSDIESIADEDIDELLAAETKSDLPGS